MTGPLVKATVWVVVGPDNKIVWEHFSTIGPTHPNHVANVLNSSPDEKDRGWRVVKLECEETWQ